MQDICIYALYKYIYISMQDASRALTPRTKRWLGRLTPLLPEAQGKQIVDAFVQNAYTSVDTICEDSHNVEAMPALKTLKAGAKIAFRKKLAELVVSEWLMIADYDRFLQDW
jgi:hypothetical protein